MANPFLDASPNLFAAHNTAPNSGLVFCNLLCISDKINYLCDVHCFHFPFPVSLFNPQQCIIKHHGLLKAVSNGLKPVSNRLCCLSGFKPTLFERVMILTAKPLGNG